MIRADPDSNPGIWHWKWMPYHKTIEWSFPYPPPADSSCLIWQPGHWLGAAWTRIPGVIVDHQTERQGDTESLNVCYRAIYSHYYTMSEYGTWADCSIIQLSRTREKQLDRSGQSGQIWVLARAPGVRVSLLRLVGPVSIYCDWMR